MFILFSPNLLLCHCSVKDFPFLFLQFLILLARLKSVCTCLLGSWDLKTFFIIVPFFNALNFLISPLLSCG